MATVSRDLLKAIRDDLNAALAVIAETHGLSKLEVGRGSYDSVAGSFTFKVDGVVRGGLTPDQQRYEQTRSCNHWWPERGVIVTSKPCHLRVDGMGAGGRIMLVDDKGASYTMKHDAFTRKYPCPALTPAALVAGVQS